ncbi:alpha/beta hydrolase fold domain-containing protein [Muriicola sp. SD30]|uniref:alpha/beta hydrolase fold domain-containing protein n=1 Tax=Muriicola sp. SD30 TaxID=3240936 RepID=UPI00350F2175
MLHKKGVKNWVILLLGMLAISCSSTFEEVGSFEDDIIIPEEEVVLPLEELSLLDESYGENPQQVYDIYLPATRSSEKTRVILLVHGGGWVEGDKASMTPFIELIKERHPKHAIVNMNYVLAGLTPVIPAFPNQFLDIGKVIDKITSEKEKLQLLPEFGLIGTSAGAHLSLMYDFAYDTEDQVKFVVDIVGPTDFTHPFFSEDPNFGLALSLFVDESQYPQGTNYAEATSPVFNVSTMSSPVAMFYGNQDPLVPLGNGEGLDEALTDFGIPHSFTIYEGGHGDDWSEADILDLQQQISAFIEAYLMID